MVDLIGLLIYLILLVVPVLLGFFIGSSREKSHYESILKREKQFLELPAVPSKNVVETGREIVDAKLVTGGVVISVDAFKRILIGLRGFFGGRVSAYESLVDRARREAVLRMQEMAQGADLIINLRIETASVGQGASRGGNRRQSIHSVEMFAYGTAITYKK